MRHHKLPILIIILGLIGLIGLSACAQNNQPMGKPLPVLTYGHLHPYTPYGGAVQIKQSFEPAAQHINTVREFPMAPDALLMRYAQRRFSTDPALPVKLVFDVKNASLSKKKDSENLVGFLSGAAENSYLLEIFITLSPVDKAGKLQEPFTIDLKRSLYIPQRISLAEKEFREFEFLEKTISDIDATVTKFVQERM